MKKRKIENMNRKITTNSQLSTTEPITTKTKTKQTTKTGRESEKWTSHGRFSMGRGRGGMGGKCTGKKKHNW